MFPSIDSRIGSGGFGAGIVGGAETGIITGNDGLIAGGFAALAAGGAGAFRLVGAAISFFVGVIVARTGAALAELAAAIVGALGPACDTGCTAGGVGGAPKRLFSGGFTPFEYAGGEFVAAGRDGAGAG